MEDWLKTCILLCSFGFFKELRPSEPFLTEYLLGPQHNLTENQVYFDVYPVWTYSYLSLLVVVFLVTDLLRYKPVIVFEGVGYVATWSLLLWARGVRWMQFMEFLYGIATSTEVAYYTYIYAQVDARYYQRVTSYTRSAFLAGRFLSGVLAQLLYSFDLMDYHSLNYLSLTGVSIALCISCILPPVKNSIYFHRKEGIEGFNDLQVASEGLPVDGDLSSHVELVTAQKANKASAKKSVERVFRLLWDDFKESYNDSMLLKWSVWWAFATCINFQVGNYIQPLWESILPFHSEETLYNGATEATSTLLASVAAFGIGYLHVNWNLIGEMTLAVISLIDALLLTFMGLTSNIYVGYVNYVAFRVSYQVLITVASYQVAKGLRAECYGLVFGINMFMALLFQTILTVIVADWLQIEPALQFLIYGGYVGALSLLFFIISIHSLCSLGLDGIKNEGFWIRPSEVQRSEAPVGTTESY